MNNLLLSMEPLNKMTMNFPPKKEIVDGIKTTTEVDLGLSSEFSRLNSEKTKIDFNPKIRHVG
jgi:hypothetical protein